MTTKLILEFPIKHGEEEVKELEFRRPTFRDVKGTKITDLENFNSVMSLTAKLTNKPESIFNAMDLVDVLKCGKVIGDFLSSFHQMQENASSI